MNTQAEPSRVEMGRERSETHIADQAHSGPRTRPCTVIRPPVAWQPVNFRELWQFRELLGFLVWRDVKVRYKQTLLGAAWAVLQPLLMMLVFTIFFGRLAGVSTGDIPYPLFAYAGLLPWTFFATAVANAGNSVVGSERLITKVYFPRLAVPFAAVGAAVVDFVVAFGLLVVMMLYYGFAPGPGMLLVPLIFAPMVLAALGVGTLLAALNVSYRDFRYVIPFLVQLWMFAPPTVYMQPAAPSDAVVSTPAASTAESSPRSAAAARGAGSGGAAVQAALALNPMTGLIGGFRELVLGRPVHWRACATATMFSALAFIAGCIYFRKVEDNLADVI